MESMDILLQHPSNKVVNKNEMSKTNKGWTKVHEPITRTQLKRHTVFEKDGTIHARWTAFVLPDDDDNWRRAEQSVEANPRSMWLLANEDDMTAYFQQEIVAIVMSKFTRMPAIHHRGKSPPKRGGVIVDSEFRWGHDTVAIGEYKRNIFDADKWMNGEFRKDKDQERLGREIRGYATIYECPQIYLFDGRYLVLFQFRAHSLKNFSDCDVDCWIIPRVEKGSPHSVCAMRDAFYRFIVQGLRRCQSQNIPAPRFGGLTSSRAFFSGEACWKIGDEMKPTPPEGFERQMNDQGVFVWMYNGQPFYYPNNTLAVDSKGLWGSRQQMTLHSSEDIYSAD